jgi:hypothetical protein
MDIAICDIQFCERIFELSGINSENETDIKPRRDMIIWEQNRGPVRIHSMQKRRRRARALLVTEDVDRIIYVIRGRRVMLDSDLAKIYGVTTKRLNEQVRRNRARFPEDFMFQLTLEELENWRSQIATSNSSARMGLRYRPYAFTEHGAVMLASVLKSPIAVGASIQIVRAFNRLRRLVAADKDLAAVLAALERKVAGHDEEIQALFEAIHEIMEPPAAPSREIGFSVKPGDP